MFQIIENNSFIQLIIVFLISLVIGSFIGLTTYRLPLNQDVILKSSHCPNCNTLLKWFNLIPLFSWIFQKGKCYFCKVKIKSRYFIIELFTAISATIIYYLTNDILMIPLVYILITLCIIDIEYLYVPDTILLCLLSYSLFYFLKKKIPYENILSVVIIFTIFSLLKLYYLKFRKIDPLGNGDLKFCLTCLFLFPPTLIPLFLFTSGLTGCILGIFWKIKVKKITFPFIPSLALSLLICLSINNYVKIHL